MIDFFVSLRDAVFDERTEKNHFTFSRGRGDALPPSRASRHENGGGGDDDDGRSVAYTHARTRYGRRETCVPPTGALSGEGGYPRRVV